MGINLGAVFAAPMVNALAGAIDLTSSICVLSFCGFGFAALAIFEYTYNFFDKKNKCNHNHPSNGWFVPGL
ncbi:hypothetical protein FOA32_001730 [Streptococcus sinensis]|nr:hypothetical protein [Streptococcus sinensis]